MPRNGKSRSNGQKPITNGAHKNGTGGTAIATVEPPALPTISRSEANKLLKQRAQELYHDARSQREERIRQFEAEYGRADRIDHTLLRDLQQLQARFAAIAARQFKFGSETEPKVSKFTKQLGDIIGELSSHLATERALELFAPVEERDYVGMGGTIGRKGLDERSSPATT
jgi:paraquat-inducible protein B